MTRSRKALILALAVVLPSVPTFAKGKKGSTTAPAAANTNATTISADLKDISDDRTALATAQKELDDGAVKLTTAFEASDPVVAAKKAITDDSAVVQTARDAVMSKLSADATYKAAVAKEQKARSELNDLRGNGADQDAISAKATEVFNDGSETSKIERTALEGDTAWAAASKKLADDNKTLSDMRTTFKDGLKTDTTLASLRQARDDAQTKLTAAQAKLATDRGGATSPSSSTPTSSGY